ncbi:MAG TPA: FHA domain-containing protein [Pirellulales bacterium]|nr:FHA domain-containing protein [Pirellulales bacterium]
MSMVGNSPWRKAISGLSLVRLAMNDPMTRRFVIWIDAVGGFLVCLADEVTFGQATADSRVDVPLVADVARRHATIRRDDEGYVLDPAGETWLDGRSIQSPAPLADSAALRLGPVALQFRQPHPLSATARVELASPHRMRPSYDAVLLLAQSCVMGPRPTSHIVCPDWPQEVVLFHTAGKLDCRFPGEFEIDGRMHTDGGRVGFNSCVAGEGLSFTLEEL